MDQRESNNKLIKLIQQGIDTEKSYEQLFNQNIRFIHTVIKNRVHGIYEYEDLLQSSFLALVKAVELFEPEREQINFLTLLKYCIYNELREETNRLPANMIRKIMNYKKAYNTLYNELGRRPKNYELMYELHISLNQLEEIRKANQINYPLSLDEPISDEEGAATRLELYSDSQGDEEEAFENIIDSINLKEILEEALNKIPENAQEVIKNRYYKNMTLKQCGHELNVCKERVR